MYAALVHLPDAGVQDVWVFPHPVTAGDTVTVQVPIGDEHAVEAEGVVVHVISFPNRSSAADEELPF